MKKVLISVPCTGNVCQIVDGKVLSDNSAVNAEVDRVISSVFSKEVLVKANVIAVDDENIDTVVVFQVENAPVFAPSCAYGTGEFRHYKTFYVETPEGKVTEVVFKRVED